MNFAFVCYSHLIVAYKDYMYIKYQVNKGGYNIG